MSENDVEVIEICGEEKENILKGKKKKSDGENNNNIVNEEKEELTITGLYIKENKINQNFKIYNLVVIKNRNMLIFNF